LDGDRAFPAATPTSTKVPLVPNSGGEIEELLIECESLKQLAIVI
jgi:hypothetical protein